MRNPPTIKLKKRFFVKFGGNLFFISMVFLFFFLNPIKVVDMFAF